MMQLVHMFWEVAIVAWVNAFSLEQVGAFLKSARRERGYTQQEYAEVIGISRATLSSMENGTPVMSCHLEKALQFLGFRIVVVPKSARVIVDERPNGTDAS